MFRYFRHTAFPLCGYAGLFLGGCSIFSFHMSNTKREL